MVTLYIFLLFLIKPFGFETFVSESNACMHLLIICVCFLIYIYALSYYDILFHYFIYMIISSYIICMLFCSLETDFIMNKT
jgi:hypothetical protein